MPSAFGARSKQRPSDFRSLDPFGALDASSPKRPYAQTLTLVLDDLFVLELASVLAGPSVGQFFAELGATVVKVENPNTEGDVTRRWTAPGSTETDETLNGEDEAEETGDRSAYFCCCNHGKQSVAVDLSTEEGQNLLHDLAREADVVLASFRPGRAESLGADSETLRALNPSLIYGHVTGYGPDDERPGYDAVIQAEAGFTFMNGPADGPPTKLPVALMDVLAAHQLKEGLLLALLRRERTGAGAYIPVSLLQAGVSGLVNQATNWLVDGHVPQRMGSAHPNIAPYGTAYETADGRSIVLAVGTDRQFETLCHILGLTDLATSPNFATNEARLENREALERVLEVRIRQFEADDLLDAFRDHHIPCGVVRDMPSVFEHPEANAQVLRPDDGPAGLRQTAFPTAPASSDLSPPPHYAEHTGAVLRTHLGRSDDEIDRLTSDGVVEQRT